MKKTLAALAVLGAFAGTALAADVTLYGVLDEGFLYTHVDSDAQGADAVDNLQMKSGMQAASRFGFKGSEDLGNGMKVSFILESGFDADTGDLNQGKRLFGREASVSLSGAFGQVSFGRLGTLGQGVSSWGKGARLSAFGTSYTNYSVQAGAMHSTAGVRDNMVGYQTPSFAGFKAYAQYSFGTDAASGAEGTSKAERYYALGATFDQGPFAATLVVDSVNYPSVSASGVVSDVDDSLTVTAGVSYDFQVAKVFVSGQYYDEVKIKSFGGLSDAATAVSLSSLANLKVKGWSSTVSAAVPLFGGAGLVGFGYLDANEADSQDSEFDVSQYVVSAGYSYPLSKRTNIYGAVTYGKIDLDVKGGLEQKPSYAGALVGVRHNF